MKRVRLVVALAATLSALTASPARADDLDQAKTLFSAGAQAYAQGRWGEAVSAFEDAYKLAPNKPQLEFSLAQAEKKQYFATKDDRLLVRAIEHYRKYLADVPSGGRRADATDALGELEPLAARLSASPSAAPAAAASTRAKLYVHASVDGASVLLDGAAVGEAPFIGEIDPGKHKVSLRKDGYFDEEREVLGERGGRTTVDLELRERPARLTVSSSAACDVYVDGRLVATAPMSAPVDVAPGPHIVAAVKNGARLFSKEVAFERGKPVTVPVAFTRTTQRTWSYVLLGSGAAGLVAGGVFGGVSLAAEGSATNIRNARAQGNISAQDLADYNSAIDRRDTWRTAALVTGGAGLAVAGIGAFLFVFDTPEITALPAPADERRPSPKKPDFDVGFAPLVGPGETGVGVFGRF